MAHDELPLPDYDHLLVGSIGSRIRTLDADEVERVLDHERRHADRVQVVQLLQHRLDALRKGEAEPSGGSPDAPTPETSSGVPAGSPVLPDTQGPPQNPPSHGDPTNPAQPRT